MQLNLVQLCSGKKHMGEGGGFPRSKLKPNCSLAGLWLAVPILQYKQYHVCYH